MPTSKTSLTLLDAICDPQDHAAWHRFDTGYRPMLCRFATSLGLSPDDADEAAQRAITKFAAAHQRSQYDSQKGRFKNYLFTITRNEIADLIKERAKQPAPFAGSDSRTDLAAQMPDPASLSIIWDRQWRAHTLGLCLDRARTQFSDRDVDLFENLALDRQPVDQVADRFELTDDAVRQVKHRVLKFLRSIRPEFELSE